MRTVQKQGLVFKREDGTIIEKGIREIVIGENIRYDNITNTLSAVGGGVVAPDSFYSKVVDNFDDLFGGNRSRVHTIVRGTNPDNISDGDGDIYDNGNKIVVNTVLKIIASGSGAPKSNEAFVHEGVVFFCEEISNFQEFRIEGNYGSDSNTVKEHFDYGINVNGTQCYVVVNKQEQTTDPHVYTCMIMIGASIYSFNYADAISNTNTDKYNYIITPTEQGRSYKVANITFAHKQEDPRSFSTDEIKSVVEEFITLITE